jgi:hypothetical protein
MAAGSVMSEPIRGTTERLKKNMTVFLEIVVILEITSDKKLIDKFASVRIGFYAATTMIAKTNNASV